MRQTRFGSVIESFSNVVIGFGISFLANIIVLPWFGFHVTARDAFGIGIIFTVISIVRSYVLRRVFNKIKELHHD